MLSVDPDCLDYQAAFLAPTASDARSQRSDTLRRATLDNQPYSLTFPSLKHLFYASNLPSLSSRTKTNPVKGNRTRRIRLMPTTPPRNKHFMLGTALLCPVVKHSQDGTVTMTQTPRSLRVTAIFHTITMAHPLSEHQQLACSTRPQPSRIRGGYPPKSRSKTLSGLRRGVWNSPTRSQDGDSSFDNNSDTGPE